MSPLRLLFALALPMLCQAEFLNLPQLTKGRPPKAEYYTIIQSDKIGASSAHAVHGIGSQDGGLVASGSYTATGIPDGDVYGQLNRGGFVLKVDAAGKYLWHHNDFVRGYYGAILCIDEAPASDGHAIYAAGLTWTSATQRYDRLLLKLNSKGALQWRATFPDTIIANEGDMVNGGIEFIDVDSETGDLYLSGFTNGFHNMNIGEFKSGGKPDCLGCAWAAKLPAAALRKSTAPTKSDFVWSRTTFGEAHSGTSIRHVPGGEAIMLTHVGAESKASVILLDGAHGGTLWQKGLSKQDQGADIAVAPSTDYFVVTGLGFTPQGVDGQFTQIFADGREGWSVTEGHVMPEIGVECWGVQIVEDALGEGIIAACGMGVESCAGTLSPAMERACNAMGFQTWKNYNLRLDNKGAVVWQRVDEYCYPENRASENGATEYVAILSNGGAFAINDNDSGIGFLKLDALDSSAPDAKDTCAAPVAPEPAPEAPEAPEAQEPDDEAGPEEEKEVPDKTPAAPAAPVDPAAPAAPAVTPAPANGSAKKRDSQSATRRALRGKHSA